MTNDKKSKVTVTMTRNEADWLLNLLDRLSKDNSITGSLSAAKVKHGFQAAFLADRIRAEG
jgi:hypothetical protein